MSLPSSVIAVVKEQFSSQEHSEILNLLSTYGIESYEREVERVLLDLLILSNGKKSEVIELVKRAKQDYRDIIFWAENPEQAKLDTPEKIEQFNKMLEKFGAKWRVQGK